jgi:mono/diheme cytochrome c family protein
MSRTLLAVLSCACVAGFAFAHGPAAAPRSLAPQPAQETGRYRPAIPQTWDEAALEEWATPLAGLNARPKHMSSAEYYAMPVDNLRSFPFYPPDREPAGYWDRLQALGPQPLIDPATLATDADWVAAGQRVFDDADHIHLRTSDPELLAQVRDPVAFARLQGDALPDGTIADLRWVPTKDGVALSFPSCATCHTAVAKDLTRIPGAPAGGSLGTIRSTGLVTRVHYARRVVFASSPFIMAPGDLGTRLYQAWGVPWRKDDEHERLKTMTREEFEPLRINVGRSRGFLRWNGSPFHPTKVPDLIGIEDRKYIDATATHLHRNIGDLMRYAALVMTSEPADFGPHHVLVPGSARVQSRRSDEALYALARYIYSLKPPPNPNPFDDKARAGQAIFEREDCQKCHTPPLYTNNKLTIAEGFRPPVDLPASLDVMRKTVGTDSGLALKTRKGTGYYKVPSLRGVWYRGRYLHDGAAATLEEMFDPNRLNDTHVRGGWAPLGVKARAIKGHDFGLELEPEERAELIAFLRTL